MRADVIGDLLPSAAAVAISPIPVVAVASCWGRRGPVSIVVVLVVAPGSDADSNDPGVSWFEVALGALFLVLAGIQWRKRPREGQEAKSPKWLATIDTVSASTALMLGAGLAAANPKNLALTLAAAASIAEAGLDQADEVIAIVVFVALGSATVAGAVLFYLIDARRAARPLEALRRFMTDHSAAIMIVVLVLLGD